MNPAIGSCGCPFCSRAATVHRESRGKRALYFKCSGCGVIQPRLASGQEWMNLHTDFYTLEKAPEKIAAAVAEVAAEVREVQKAEVRKVQKVERETSSWLQSVNNLLGMAA